MYGDQIIPQNHKVDARLLDLWPDGAALTIHLPGGAMRAFLDCLRDNELMATLGDWAQNGGPLIGASAGAILMTPSVALDAVFTGEDPEMVRLPHFDDGADDLPTLLVSSART